MEGIGWINDGIVYGIGAEEGVLSDVDGMAENPTEETEGVSCAEVGYWFVYELTTVPLDLGTHIFVA